MTIVDKLWKTVQKPVDKTSCRCGKAVPGGKFSTASRKKRTGKPHLLAAAAPKILLPQILHFREGVGIDAVLGLNGFALHSEHERVRGRVIKEEGIHHRVERHGLPGGAARFERVQVSAVEIEPETPLLNLESAFNNLDRLRQPESV